MAGVTAPEPGTRHQSVGNSSWTRRLCLPPFADRVGGATHSLGSHPQGSGRAECLVDPLALRFSTRQPNYFIRAVHPAATAAFATAHDARLWQCLCSILQVDPSQADVVRETATVPLSLGGLGLRSAQRTSIPAFWASWADSLAMIRQRHPDVAAQLVHELERHPEGPCLQAAADAARYLHGVYGFVPPSWEALSHGARPEPIQPDDFEPGCQCGGWQHEAASRVEARFRDANLFRRLDDASKALVRSQGGVGAGLALSICPLCRVTRLEPHLFRVLLLRRLRLPLPLSGRSCRCGQPLDSSGHHRAACARAGVLGRRGFALESVAARICREAGGRVMTNVVLRDLDLVGPNQFDTRRLEVVVDGLPLFEGVLAVDNDGQCPSRHGDAGGLHTRTGWLWQLLEGVKSAPTQNWSPEGHMLGWSCWASKWVAGGRRRRAPS